MRALKLGALMIIAAAVCAAAVSLPKHTAFECGESYTFYLGSSSSNCRVMTVDDNAGLVLLTLKDVRGEATTYAELDVESFLRDNGPGSTKANRRNWKKRLNSMALCKGRDLAHNRRHQDKVSRRRGRRLQRRTFGRGRGVYRQAVRPPQNRRRALISLRRGVVQRPHAKVIFVYNFTLCKTKFTKCKCHSLANSFGQI